MVVSDKYKYVFVELPHTGSTSISSELCEHYGGIKVLKKHSRYGELLKLDGPKRDQYFVFSGIRNPIDEAVTRYFRYKTNHKERYTNPAKWQRNGGTVSDYSVKMYRYIKENDADFAAFLKRFYRWLYGPYDNWSNLYHKKMDYLIRFEAIQEGFSNVLRLLDLPEVRELPRRNKTAKRADDFWPNISEDSRPYVAWMFGPFLKEWNYEFPSEWGKVPIPTSSQALFRLLRVVRRRLWAVEK